MLASSAEDIKLWDIRFPLQHPDKDEDINNTSAFPPLQPAKRWTPIVSGPNWTNIHDLSWSHSANTISCAPSKYGGIVFCSVDQSLDGSKAQVKKGIVGHRCVDVGDKDRFLVTAGQDSTLYLYSMTRCKLWHEFKCHNGNVTAAIFNASSSHIASGSEKGEIILSNISTKESSAPLLAPRVQMINKLCYNPYKTSILGSVSSDGAVNIWDAGRAKLLHSANQVHTSSATGLAYFTDNHHLLTTVGLDGKLALFDINNLSVVSITTLKSGITCVDVGGDVIALGTKQGAIYLYDHRNMKTPFIYREAAHKSAVNCIKIRKLEEKLTQLNQSLENLSQMSAGGLRNSSRSNLGILNAGSELSPLRPAINFEENGLFSPESQHNSTCPSDLSFDQSGLTNANITDVSLMWQNMDNVTVDMSLQRIVNSTRFDQSNADLGPFTDEEKINCSTNSYTHHPQEVRRSPFIPSNIQNPVIGKSPRSPLVASPLQPPLRPGMNPNDHKSVRQQQGPIPMHFSPPNKDAPQVQSDSDKNLGKQEIPNISGGKSTTNPEKPSLSTQPVPNANLKTSQMQVSPSLTTTNTLGSTTSSGFSSSTTVPPSNAFSFKLIHSVVQDAMEEFTEQIYDNFLSMQVNILRMFQQQQAELRSDMQHQTALVMALMAENQQLKQENKQLRKNY